MFQWFGAASSHPCCDIHIRMLMTSFLQCSTRNYPFPPYITSPYKRKITEDEVCSWHEWGGGGLHGRSPRANYTDHDMSECTTLWRFNKAYKYRPELHWDSTQSDLITKPRLKFVPFFSKKKRLLWQCRVVLSSFWDRLGKAPPQKNYPQAN
jgi:hypothetical protein